MRQHKLFSAAVPVELGGAGASYSEIALVIRELAHYDGSTALAFSMHSHLLRALIWRNQRSLTPPSEPVLRRIAAEELVLVSTRGSDWLDGFGNIQAGRFVMNFGMLNWGLFSVHKEVQQVELMAGIDLGALVWIALALTGAALIVGGTIVFLTRKTVLARSLAGAAVAVGLVGWVALIFTLPVSTNVEYQSNATAREARVLSTLLQPTEATVRSSYGSGGDEEGQFIQILEADLELQQLNDHYLQQILQHSGVVSSELLDQDLSVLSWQFSDADNRLNRGILIITPTQQDNWLVSETFVVLSP